MGQYNSIAVRKSITIKYPKPYSECADLNTYSSDLYDFITKHSNRTYRQRDCISLCKQKSIIKKCKCYSLEYPGGFVNDTTIGPCLNSKQSICIYNLNETNAINSCVDKSCPLECHSVEYDLTLSSMDMPSKTFANKNNRKNMSYEDFKRQYLLIDVHLSSLQYTLISETPKMSLIDLLAQIGGSLSIFVSLNIFSLIEIGEFLFIFVYVSIFQR
jgi:hypothetical protein